MDQALPRFTGLRKIGEGAVAELFQARDAQTGELALVKILRPELTSEAEIVGRFLDEARLCQTLSHPNVVRHLDSGRFHDGRVYLALEWLDGEDLAALLRRQGPLDEAALVELMQPLCDALDYLHLRGIVHRDLKPDNVFLVGGLSAGKPKLLDFGLALFRGTRSVKTSEGMILSAPEYTAPECVSGQKAGPGSDLYALGVLMYEALSGRLPFQSPRYGDLLLMHLHQAPPPLPESCAVLAPVVMRCLQKDPAARFPNAAELAAALERALSPIPLERQTLPGAVSAARESDETPPQQLGSYELVKPLGKGGMGTVYLARHVRLGRQVAIKVLLPEHARDVRTVQRFFQEARAVNEINHEHIVEIFDFVEMAPEGTAAPLVYCVMELLSGESLSKLMQAGPLPVRRIAGVGAQIASALAAAHRVGVVHRDVKPDNVIVTQRNGADFAKVLDFGVAKFQKLSGSSSNTVTGSIVGTPSYMAPEQASGEGVEPRSDIYALGVILYEMLAGALPFDAGSFGQLVVQILTRPPPPLPAKTRSGQPIPDALRGLVFRCLEKAPAKRPASMEEVAQALQLIAATSDAPASAPAPRRTRGRSFARWTLRIVALAVFLELVGLVALEIPPAREKLAPHVPARVVDRMDEVTAAVKEHIRPGERPASPRARFRGAPAPSAGTVKLDAGNGVLEAGLIEPDAGIGEGDADVELAPAEDVSAPQGLVASGEGESAQAGARAAPLAAIETVRVRVESVPPGAMVIRQDDGTALGTTPFEASVPRAEADLALRVELAGYQPASKTVRLSDDGVVKVTLARKPAQPDPKPKTDLSREGVVDPFQQ